MQKRKKVIVGVIKDEVGARLRIKHSPDQISNSLVLKGLKVSHDLCKPAPVGEGGTSRHRPSRKRSSRCRRAPSRGKSHRDTGSVTVLPCHRFPRLPDSGKLNVNPRGLTPEGMKHVSLCNLTPLISAASHPQGQSGRGEAARPYLQTGRADPARAAHLSAARRGE
jgi:hypothetical protein